MKTKIILLSALLYAVSIVIISGNKDNKKNLTYLDKRVAQQDAFTSMNYRVYNFNVESDVFRPQLEQGFSTDSLVVGPEIMTGISGYYDYKTNGEANVYIQVDPSHPDSINVVDVTADTLDHTGVTSRRTEYAFSTDGGQTWSASIEVPDALRSGYPVLHLRNSAAVIANHSEAVGGRLDANLYVDVVPQAGSFTQYGHPNPSTSPFGIWPQIAIYNNGNVGLVSRRNVSSTNPPETLYYSFWNGTVMSPRTPVYITSTNFNGSVGSNMRFHLATNGTGRVTVIAAPVNQNDTLGDSKIFARTSTDNGVTWGLVTTVFAPYTENSGQDTIATAGGSGFIYKPGTSTWFLAYPISKITEGLAVFANGKLVITRSDGATSTITTAAQVGAATTYAQNMSFVFNVDFPALGWSADGSTLYCVYSVVMPDIAPTNYNQRDIFVQYSLDNGTTWSNPLRLTNTVNIDETYPSVSFWNRGTQGGPYQLNITYMKDPGVGPASFGGNAPSSRNFQIYRKLTGLAPIGIANNQNILKEYRLSQNYPNPFNPSTKISYNIVKSSHILLKVYDILGREVAILVNEVQQPGFIDVIFNANNLPSGIYFYTINAGEFTDTKKMILVK